MRLPCSVFIFSTLLLPLLANANANDQILEQCAQAKDADIIGLALGDNGETLYCEYHTNQTVANELVATSVKYVDGKGQSIAQKQLDYLYNSLVPNVLQEDFRQGEIRALNYSADQQQFSLAYQQSRDVEEKSAVIDLDDAKYPWVADAGFDRLLKDNWAALSAGETLPFSFLSPIHARRIDLVVKQVDESTCVDSFTEVGAKVCFSVEPKSSMLRLFAKPLNLLYEKSTQRLLVFSGVVNLVDANGKPKMANIHYWYKSQY